MSGRGGARARRILPWREPCEALLAFANSPSVEERERRRPHLRAALRQFKRSLYWLKRPRRGEIGWSSGTRFSDPNLNIALMMLLHAVCNNPVLDDETREELHQGIARVIDNQHD